MTYREPVHDWGRKVDFEDDDFGFEHHQSPLARVIPVEVATQDFDQTQENKDLTRAAIGHVIQDSLNEAAPATVTVRERGLYEDLTIRDKSRSKAQSRLIGGMPRGVRR